MNKYTGIACVKCGSAFTDNDDVVVCPECGAPHHRECYMQDKRCTLAAKHGGGFVWKAEPASTNGGEKLDVIICGHCNSVNPSGSKLCRMCGESLSTGFDGEDIRHNSQHTETGRYSSFSDEYSTQEGSFTDFFYRESWDFDGVTARELSAYTGSNAFYYITRFRSIISGTNKRGITWNWAALVFGPFYYLYRKMYKLGFIFLAFTILTMLPTFLCFLGTLDATMQMYGATVQYNSVMMETVAPAAAILSYMRIAVSFLSAMFANKLFFQTALKDIKQYRTFFDGKQQNAEYYNGLFFYGKPNAVIVIIAAVALFIASSAFFTYTGAVLPPV